MALTRTTDWAKDVRSVLVVLERSRDSLRQAERLVAEYVLAHPGDVVGGSITEVARQAGTSEASVLRCCRSLGYGGFPEFKLALARDLARAETETGDTAPLAVSDPAERVAYLGYRSVQQAIDETMEIQQVSQFERAVTILANAEVVVVAAARTRTFLAAEAQRRLLQIGVRVLVADRDNAADALAVVRPSDAVLAFAGSDNDAWLDEVLAYSKTRGTGRVLCTPQASPADDQLAEVSLQAAARPYVAGDLTFESLAAELCLLEVLIVACALRRYDATVAALAARDELQGFFTTKE